LRLRWTRQAVEDLLHIRAWIAAEERPGTAEVVADRIEKSTLLLRRHPEAGRPGRIKGTRELVVPKTPFLIPYRIAGDSVDLLAVLHGARKWPETL
jgi:toxin ParE1/3/4